MEKILGVILIALLVSGQALAEVELDSEDLVDDYKNSLVKHEELKTKYAQSREEFRMKLDAYKNCTLNCSALENKAFRSGKYYLINAADLMSSRIELDRAAMLFSDSLNLERYSVAAEEYDGFVRRLQQTVSEGVLGAESLADLEKTAGDLNIIWGEAVFSMKRNNYMNTVEKIELSLDQAEALKARFQCAVGERSGVMREMETYISKARSLIRRAESATESGSFDEAKVLILSSYDELRKIHVLSLEMLDNVEKSALDGC